VIVPCHIRVRAHQQLVDAVDLPLKRFGRFHRLPAEPLPDPNAAQHLHTARRVPGDFPLPLGKAHCRRALFGPSYWFDPHPVRAGLTRPTPE
jgi:hypothetical protein